MRISDTFLIASLIWAACLSAPVAVYAQRTGSGLNMPNRFDPFNDSNRLVGKDTRLSEIDSSDIAVPLDSVKPLYPIKALSARIAGYVWLKIKLSPEGIPQQTQIVECFPEWQDFEPAAVKAVKEARFQPPPNTGRRKISKWMHFVVNFDPYVNPYLGDTLPAVDSLILFDTPAAPTKPIEIRYLSVDHQVQVEDTGIIKVLIDSNGLVRDYQIVKSGGKDTVDSAAVYFAKTQPFTPAKYQGASVATWVDVPFVYDRTDHFLAVPWISAVAVPGTRQLLNKKTTSRMEIELGFDDELKLVPVKSFYQYPDSTLFGPVASVLQKLDFATPSKYVSGDSTKISHRCILVQTQLAEIDSDSLPSIYEVRPTGDWYVPPACTYTAPITYDESAREYGIEGSAEVAVLVDDEGAVRIATLTKESGIVPFDRLAIEAAIRNRYSPATLGGQTIAVWVTYKVDFKLE